MNDILGDIFEDETPRSTPVRVIKIWRLCFMNRKGGYNERVYADPEKLARACRRLGLEAEIKDARGDVIGRVERAHWGDRGRKWSWYFEPQSECD